MELFEFFSWESLLVGLLAIAIGLAFSFWGFRVFLILLPIWGFFAGFILGANGVQAIFGDAFLSTVLSWVVGFLLGLLFAVLSYLYYWVAVILLGGALGYQLTIGLLQWIGFEATGLFAFILALAGGALFAVGFFLLRMPAVLVIVATAISGAMATIAGIVVGLGLVPVSALDTGLLGGLGKYVHPDTGELVNVELGWIWIIIGIALAFAGAIYQTRTIADMSAAITADSYMNPGLDEEMAGPRGSSPA
jgi:hypothetical protein